MAAMQLEANAVADALEFARAKPGRSVEGTFGGIRVSIALIGIGGRSFPQGSFGPRPDSIILAGLSGALDPMLKIGDVVVDGLDGNRPLPAGWRRGRVFSGGRILSSPREKAACFAETGAPAVDMESQTVRRWASEHGVPFIAIRSISDRADQQLDPAVLNMCDVWGRPRIGAALRTIACNPKLLGQTLRLARDTKRAARSLGAAVKAILEDDALDAAKAAADH